MLKKPVVLIYAKNCLDSVIILVRITEALYTSFHTRIFLLHIDFLLYSAITLNLMTYLLGHKLYFDKEHNIHVITDE